MVQHVLCSADGVTLVRRVSPDSAWPSHSPAPKTTTAIIIIIIFVITMTIIIIIIIIVANISINFVCVLSITSLFFGGNQNIKCSPLTTSSFRRYSSHWSHVKQSFSSSWWSSSSTLIHCWPSHSLAHKTLCCTAAVSHIALQCVILHCSVPYPGAILHFCAISHLGDILHWKCALKSLNDYNRCQCNAVQSYGEQWSTVKWCASQKKFQAVASSAVLEGEGEIRPDNGLLPGGHPSLYPPLWRSRSRSRRWSMK